MMPPILAGLPEIPRTAAHESLSLSYAPVVRAIERVPYAGARHHGTGDARPSHVQAAIDELLESVEACQIAANGGHYTLVTEHAVDCIRYIVQIVFWATALSGDPTGEHG